jgi:DNA-directed RNA polymerase specialized sigma24 family protein
MMMSAGARRDRRQQFERDRTVLQMRAAVLAAVAPAFVDRMGSSAVSEAVDEALAQIVATGGHLADPDAVKALWITCARRRLIDEHRSAEFRHRALTAGDNAAAALADSVGHEPARLTEDERQWWRIREILGVLRGEQRVWAEAWYDRVLSASRVAGGQPRGLADALGWTPAKTKSVSRRARMRMAAFIEDRVSGVVCEEQRRLMDNLILARGSGGEIREPRHDAVLVHVAGCEACWAAWHARRRVLLGRVRSAVTLPVDGLLIAGHTLALKLAGAGVAAHSQSHALLARVGLGGAAAAGGGAATVGGKATAVCIGVVCAATAGGEIAGVLPPLVADAPQEERSATERPKPERKPAAAARPSAAHDPTTAAKLAVARATAAAAAAQRKAAAVSKVARESVPKKVVRGTPGDLPQAALPPAASAPDSAAPATSSSGAAGASSAAGPEPAPTFNAPAATSGAEFAPIPDGAAETCAPGSFGC